VGFSGEIYDGVSLVRHRGHYCLRIADIPAYKMMFRLIESFEILRISRVSESIEIDYLTGWQIFENKSDKGRADKAGPARHKQFIGLIRRDDDSDPPSFFSR